jgi:D-alanine-D-alanine ligase
VTNILTAQIADLSAEGVLNYAQYYSRMQADEIIRMLQADGYTVVAHFDEASFFKWALRRGADHDRLTIVFNTAEGGTGQGRRALIPSFCNLLGLPIFNSAAHASTLCRHKFHANAVLARAGLRVPITWMFDSAWIGGLRPPLGTRVILKPAYESMSIGVGDDSVMIVDDQFEGAVSNRRARFGQALVAQEFITGDEIGIPVLRADRTYTLPIVSFLRADGSQFASRPRTFEDECIDHAVSQALYGCAPQQYRALQESAALAFDVLGMAGVGRIDLRVDVDGRGWIFDTNESPPPLIPTAYSRALAAIGVKPERMLSLWVGLKLLDLGHISGV